MDQEKGEGVFRERAEIVVAALRLHTHREGMAPTVAELVDLCRYSEEVTRVVCRRLEEGRVIESILTPFEERIALRRPDLLPAVVSDVEGAPSMGEHTEASERARVHRNDRLARGLDPGEQARRKAARMDDLERKFKDAGRPKPNPLDALFGDPD